MTKQEIVWKIADADQRIDTCRKELAVLQEHLATVNRRIETLQTVIGLAVDEKTQMFALLEVHHDQN